MEGSYIVYGFNEHGYKVRVMADGKKVREVASWHAKAREVIAVRNQAFAVAEHLMGEYPTVEPGYRNDQFILAEAPAIQ